MDHLDILLMRSNNHIQRYIHNIIEGCNMLVPFVNDLANFYRYVDDCFWLRRWQSSWETMKKKHVKSRKLNCFKAMLTFQLNPFVCPTARNKRGKKKKTWILFLFDEWFPYKVVQLLTDTRISPIFHIIALCSISSLCFVAFLYPKLTAMCFSGVY